MNRYKLLQVLLLVATMVSAPICQAQVGSGTQRLNLRSFGGNATPTYDNGAAFARLSKAITDASKRTPGKMVEVVIPAGEYHIYTDSLPQYTMYISNHDHVAQRKVALMLDNSIGVHIRAKGVTLLFHGRLVPIVVKNSRNITIEGLTIDYPRPALTQIEILQRNDKDRSMVVAVPDETQYKIEQNRFVLLGEGYTLSPDAAMPFTDDRHMVPMRADVPFNPVKITEIGDHRLRLDGWGEYPFSQVGNRYVLRAYYRPTPAIVLTDSKRVKLSGVTVRYAEGMGLLAQATDGVELDRFVVAPDPKGSRYFSTNADATHFSGCRGKVVSYGGEYRQMADDAINVHGTYLRIDSIVDNKTIVATFAHGQSFGYTWSQPGDKVRVIERSTLAPLFVASLVSDKPYGNEKNRHQRLLTLGEPLPESLIGNPNLAVENLSCYPEVYFHNNVIADNRARGALFSTPRKVVCRNNRFDHVHGSAILLCGDANGWYESGPCEDVLITGNTFINNLTAMYQFTDGVISIAPVINRAPAGASYYHGRVVVTKNKFVSFPTPLLSATSVREIVWKENHVKGNRNYKSLFRDNSPKLRQIGKVVGKIDEVDI